MSSTGTTRDTTPLLPWRPAILSPGCSLRFTAMKTLTIFITPGGSSSPRCSFSTLLSNRACSRPTAASNSRFSVSISAITASSCTPIWRQAPRGCSASTSSVISVPALMPLNPPVALRPSSFSRSRLRNDRSWIAFSSSRSFARRSISARSIAIARSSLSTPRRLNTRTSTTVPVTPGGSFSDVSRTSDAFSPKIARSSFSSGVIGLSPFGVTLPTRMSPGFTSAPI